MSSFTDSRVGGPIDIKTSLANLLSIGTSTTTAVAEFTLSGTHNRTFGGNFYTGVAVLPGGVLWAGGGSSPGVIDLFDLPRNFDHSTCFDRIVAAERACSGKNKATLPEER